MKVRLKLDYLTFTDDSFAFFPVECDRVNKRMIELCDEMLSGNDSFDPILINRKWALNGSNQRSVHWLATDDLNGSPTRLIGWWFAFKKESTTAPFRWKRSIDTQCDCDTRTENTNGREEENHNKQLKRTFVWWCMRTVLPMIMDYYYELMNWWIVQAKYENKNRKSRTVKSWMKSEKNAHETVIRKRNVESHAIGSLATIINSKLYYIFRARASSKRHWIALLSNNIEWCSARFKRNYVPVPYVAEMRICFHLIIALPSPHSTQFHSHNSVVETNCSNGVGSTDYLITC